MLSIEEILNMFSTKVNVGAIEIVIYEAKFMDQYKSLYDLNTDVNYCLQRNRTIKDVDKVLQAHSQLLRHNVI